MIFFDDMLSMQDHLLWAVAWEPGEMQGEWFAVLVLDGGVPIVVVVAGIELLWCFSLGNVLHGVPESAGFGWEGTNDAYVISH